MDIIVDPINVSAIEEILRQYLNLPSKNHLTIEHVFSEKHNHSEIIHFSVIWPPESVFPANLILKTKQDPGREVLFYRAVRASGTSLPVVNCLGCEYNIATGQSQILLEDMTLTHSNVSDWPAELPQQAGLQLVEALAELHAAFWTNPTPGDWPVYLPDFLQDEGAYQTHIDYLKRDFELYISGMGPYIDSTQRQIYPEILNLLPGLWRTFWAPRLGIGPLPLIHGDLNPCNILYPNHSCGKVFLVDWEACRQGLPANDLAVLLGLHLCPEFEDALPFLHHYQQNLYRLGIKNYSFDDLLSDYEISLLYELFYPLKLYAQMGIQDECLIQNSIVALKSIREARF